MQAHPVAVVTRLEGLALQALPPLPHALRMGWAWHEAGYVDQDLALEEWGAVLAELDPYVRRFISARAVNSQEPWPHYSRLTEEAVVWARRRGQ